MIFYLLHHINQYLIPWSKSTREGQKNVLTFIGGCVTYFILYGYLIAPNRTEGNSFLMVLKDFFMYFIACDVVAVSILYKLYFQRSITNEIVEVLGDKTKQNTEKINFTPDKDNNDTDDDVDTEC